MKAAYFGGSQGQSYDHSGISIEFTRSTGTVCVSGYYDGCVGIQPESVPLLEFLVRIGITRKDIEKANKQ